MPRRSKRTRLTIWPIKANLKTTHYIMSTLHPYVAMKIGKHRKVSEIDEFGGKSPSWSEPMNFDLDRWEKILQIKLYNHNRDETDQNMATATVDLNELLHEPNGERWFDLEDHMGSGGEILLRWVVQGSEGSVRSSMKSSRWSSRSSRLGSYKSRREREVEVGGFEPISELPESNWDGKVPYGGDVQPEEQYPRPMPKNVGRRSIQNEWKSVNFSGRGKGMGQKGKTMLMVKPVSGDFTGNSDLLKDMDPYLKFRVGDQVRRTEEADKGGRHPRWSTSFVFDLTNVSPNAMMEVVAFDSDAFDEDDYIGEKKFLIKRFFNKRKGEGALYLDRNNEDGGKVNVKWEYLSGFENIGRGGSVRNSRVAPGSTLSIKPIRAEFKKSLNMFMRMDPYMVIKIDENLSQRSRVDEDADCEPRWRDVLIFDLEGGESTVDINCYDRNRLGEDKLIGSATLDINNFINDPYGSATVQLDRKMKDNGTAFIEWAYDSNGGTRPFPSPEPKTYGGTWSEAPMPKVSRVSRRKKFKPKAPLTPSPQRMPIRRVVQHHAPVVRISQPIVHERVVRVNHAVPAPMHEVRSVRLSHTTLGSPVRLYGSTRGSVAIPMKTSVFNPSPISYSTVR